MIDAARSYIARGWHVFPAPVGEKKSHMAAKNDRLGRKWGATCDPDDVARYWRQWPTANVGIITGQQSGIWALDIDTPEGHARDGFASLAALVAEHGPLPETLTAESPSGSRHLYFNWPSAGGIRNTTNVPGQGLDVRGEGGMVIAPPSIKPDGAQYIWVNDAPVMDAPQWLLDLVTPDASMMPAPRPSKTPSSLAEVEELLTYVDPDPGDYGTWQGILSAIHDASGGSDDGLHLADAWSSRSKEYDPVELRDKWPSFTSGKEGGSGIGTIRHHAALGGADIHAISAMHRLSLPDYLPAGASMVPVGAEPSAVDVILARVADNPKAAVMAVAGNVARLGPADRERVLDACKTYGIKMEMKAAVKRALVEYTVAQGAERVAAAAGPLSHYYIVQNDNGQAVAVDSRGDMPPQSRRALIDALAGLDAIPVPSGDNVKMVSAVDHWWTDPETTRYAALGYDPNAGAVYLDRKEREIRNVYEPGCAGPPMPAGEATVGPFMHLVHSNFPDPSDRHMLLQALAFMAHRPGQMLRWAPVMQGTQGCGKGLIARAVSYAVGRHNTSHPSPDIIATDFNSYMYRKVLVIVDEIGDHTKRELSALAEKLKPWITDDALHVHQKGKDGFDTTNFTSWILTTNHRDKMLATPGERRYAHFISALQTEASVAVAYPSDWWSGSASYAMLEPGHDWFSYYEHWWTKCGGAEATRGFLSTVDLSDVPVRAPKTSTTEEALRESASETQNALAEAVADKARGFRGGFISSNAIRDLLRSDGIMQPHSMHLSRALASLGFVHSVRVTTSPAEKLAFADASTKTRIYYTAASDGLEPHVVSARHDQTLETKPPPVPAGITRLV